MIEPFVDADWLAVSGNAATLADVRFYLDGRSGRSAYEQGHLPEAVYVELAEVLSEPGLAPRAGRHPLPSPERFAAGLGELGIGDGDTVVAYDDAGGVVAARLVWLLRCTGHEAALLDGGLRSWRGPLEHGATSRRPRAVFTARAWPSERLAGIDEVAAAGNAVLIDARDPERFGGGPDPVDPRSGHIPGARNLPARSLVDPGGHVAGVAELRARFRQEGIDQASDVISYCGSGVTACFNLLALERAGFPAGRLFPGSWSQWSRDPNRAIRT